MEFSNIKTPKDLKNMLPEDNYYFAKESMRFFGDTMANYGIKKHTVSGELYIELRRKKPVIHGMKDSAWWKMDNGKVVMKVRSPLESRV